MIDWKKFIDEEFHDSFEVELAKVKSDKYGVNDLKDELDDFYEHHQVAFEGEDTGRLSNLFGTANELLDTISELNEEEKNLVMASVSYLINEDDVIDDNELTDGLSDDESVLFGIKQGLGI